MLKASRAAAVAVSSDALCRETTFDSIQGDDTSPWNSIADIGLLLAGLAQGLALIAAAYYIEKTAVMHRDEIDQMPYDEEVLEVERAERHRNELTRAIMKWDELSAFSRRALVLSTFAITAAFWGIMFGPSILGEESIVRDYLLTDCVSTRLDGKPWRIMTDLGWGLMIITVASLLVVRRITAYARADVDAIIADEKDFVAALEGTPKRAWDKCPNHNEPIDEARFRERLVAMLDTMSFEQINDVRRTMSERVMAPFSKETKSFITNAIDRALIRRAHE
jgi:hypothetical protein